MKPWLKKMSLVVKYEKCSDLKRVIAFIVDFFFTLLLTLLLLASSLAIFYATPNYKEALSIQENLKERSALFIEGKEAPLYLSENSLTIKEQAREALATLGFKTMENGRLAKVLATADGKMITANIDLTIGCDTDFAKKAKAPKASKAVEIDNLME